jgi:hypothetical protein
MNHQVMYSGALPRESGKERYVAGRAAAAVAELGKEGVEGKRRHAWMARGAP